MSTDLTFITNEQGQNLKNRFETLIKDTRFFDCLVGYFYASGFFNLYPSLENTEKTRILIGISTDTRTFDLLQRANTPEQPELQFSHGQTKQKIAEDIEKEFEFSDDSQSVERGVETFIQWIHQQKLEIRAYPSERIHAKVYIMTFVEGDRDIGRVITGSSNFTQAGLVENLEFNVELKNRSDYAFALRKFNELWQQSVEVSEKYVETIRTKTWLNPTISPYQLYLKFLYEYFKDELGQADEVFVRYLPEEFKKLEYQEQAVLNAKKILEEYGGVFISDVVGLGKTYISAMLAGQLDGRSLVIAPPMLLSRGNPGSWPNVFSDFRVPADFESLGKLDDILDRGVEKYTNIIIDEAHRFRTETTATYEKLAEICRGKRVVLVTATPYNNSPQDILSQLKLFQNSKKSAIPNLPNLEAFFGDLQAKFKELDRQRDRAEYLRVSKENARAIREYVLKHVMVRRTRTEIVKYFSQDLQKQSLRFPDVESPVPLFYELNEHEDAVFTRTIHLSTQDFSYARYTPLLYYTGKIDQLETQSQRNMGKFMKILLVKRLESSFHAFKNSVNRFIQSYEQFLREYDRGYVYISKKYSRKMFDLLEQDDDEAIQQFLQDGKAQKYPAADFREEFRRDLQRDLDLLREIQQAWTTVERDPKLLALRAELHNHPILKKNKLIIFTESKETAEYLVKHLDAACQGKVLGYSGSSGENVREKVIENFDANARRQKDDYRILVTTEVLSEGVNLHRSNVVMNYDIPWNPTRMMQRVGRVNRVDTPFNKIYTFNFFPTQQSNDQIFLKEAAEAKINAFLTLLGGDAELLTEGEPVASHELFNRLSNVATITGEDEAEDSELKYLNHIKQIRDEQPELFDAIKRLPKKARTARAKSLQTLVCAPGSQTLVCAPDSQTLVCAPDSQTLVCAPETELLTYFRRGKLQKFFLAGQHSKAREVEFLTVAKLLEAQPDTPRSRLDKDFYSLLDRNKAAFLFVTADDMPEPPKRRGRDSAAQVLRILKTVMRDRRQLTEDQEDYLKIVIRRLEEGALPKPTAKKALQSLNQLKESLTNPLKVLAALQISIPSRLLQEHAAEHTGMRTGRREVILSEYFPELEV